ncbi:hypothetical protein [Haliangium ochraceum]|uniref:MotA/TolQ/ExbB proton channel domain-containing protein n=1 Tax=Haliangium ochraceum (strain DSM 14365 / JCM 11303 / SMP-2) TaxID=502025 RepID=D0LL22_HALO1|nr:hypothetical protein [Haliangium ochraceum]ACY16742.1 hypothetical protein Hoch_4245 [Haliangium ochraceum DSM 14365]
MQQLMNEGGFVMWLLALTAGAALTMQGRRAYTWFVSGDLSSKALARNTATPLYLAATTLCFGLAGSALGFRAALSHASTCPHGRGDLLIGAAEALAPLVLGGMLAGLIVLVQAAMAARLRSLEIKMPV